VPPDLPTPGTPQHWLARAQSHLAIAGQPKPAGVFWEELAYHTQQAAEYAIKAVYEQYELVFDYTHDIEELLAALAHAASQLTIPEDVSGARELSKYALKTRYPGMAPPVTETDFRKALQLAETVVAWSKTQIKPVSP